jgi:gamma-glutamylcysteine synthetase
MRDHLGARGPLAHHMMKATAGTQLTLDYHDERGAGNLMRRALSLSPIVTALCANSPLG